MERRPYGVYVLYDAARWVPWTVALWWQSAVGALIIGSVAVAHAVIKWRTARYRVVMKEGRRFYSLVVRQGVCCRHTLHIDAAEAASVEVECTPILWMCGGRRVRVSTAGLRRRADVVLYLSADEVRDLFGLRAHRAARRQTRWWPIAVLALTGSNAAAGLLTVVPTLRAIERVVGEQLVPPVSGVAIDAARAEWAPLLQLIADAAVIGWIVAAIMAFLRYVGFYAVREETYLHIVSGSFTRRDVLIDSDKITAICLRQTLWMRPARLHTVSITAAGYGRDMGARPVLIPAADPYTVCGELSRLLPDFPLTAREIRPTAGAVWRYVASPLVLLVSGMVLWQYEGVFRHTAIAVTVWALWWLCIRLLGARTDGLGQDMRGLVVWYTRGLATERVYLPREAVDYIAIVQSPLGRWRHTCRVSIRCFGEKKRRYRVWGLPYAAVQEFVLRFKKQQGP